jgi:tryptophan-rich sensory protein
MFFLANPKDNGTIRNSFGLIWFLAPLLIFLFSWLTMRGGKSPGECVAFRPPKETYSIVWIFLVGTLMVSWVFISREAPRTEWIFLLINYLLIIAFCILWLYMYPLNILYGIPVFLCLLFVLAMTMQIASSVSKFSVALLWPLMIWAIFNLVVNCAETYCL